MAEANGDVPPAAQQKGGTWMDLALRTMLIYTAVSMFTKSATVKQGQTPPPQPPPGGGSGVYDPSSEAGGEDGGQDGGRMAAFKEYTAAQQAEAYAAAHYRPAPGESQIVPMPARKKNPLLEKMGIPEPDLNLVKVSELELGWRRATSFLARVTAAAAATAATTAAAATAAAATAATTAASTNDQPNRAHPLVRNARL